MEYGTSLSFLQDLTGQMLRINRGGPESRNGRLLAVKPDHLVLLTEEEGPLYYPIDHLKSITWDSQQFIEPMTPFNSTENIYSSADNLQEVLLKMKYCWIQINRGGPECIQGILIVSSENEILLVANDQLITIFIPHLQNISYVLEPVQTKSVNESDVEQRNEEKKIEVSHVSEQQNHRNHRSSKKAKVIRTKQITVTRHRKNPISKKRLLAAGKVKNTLVSKMKRENTRNYTCPAPWLSEKIKSIRIS